MSGQPDVLIVGSGPVGLLLAALLNRRAVDVTIIERDETSSDQSRAIGITPPSLEILSGLGLLREFVNSGVPIRSARVHDDRRIIGQLGFGSVPGRFPFVLALPQVRTMQILERAVGRRTTILRGHRLIGLDSEDGLAMVSAQGEDRIFKSQLIVGCDGSRSDVRGALGIVTRRRISPFHFVMGDFDDVTGWEPEAHLFFTQSGSVESFPLPQSRRRWIVRTRPGLEPDAAYLRSEVARMTGVDLTDARLHWSSVFRVNQIMARRYGRDRVALCGDACHAISPIGGQGMNTGFADARVLAEMIPEVLAGVVTPQVSWDAYLRRRGPAAKAAARRGWGWVWLGTRRGAVLSTLRRGAVAALLASPLQSKLAEDFTMLSLPGSTSR